MGEEAIMNDKPLGGKVYGKIPHLPGSRLGTGDHHCSPGQAVIATEKARDRHDVVIVQEKLDGSCVAAAVLESGELVALGRAGHLAQSSPYPQHQLWAAFVREHHERFRAVLRPGERVVGEWLAQAHGTRYTLSHEPFVAFDIICNARRFPYCEMQRRILGRFTTPAILALGPTRIEDAMAALYEGDGNGPFGFHGAAEHVEGAVWRVERNGEVDFLCKYVRHDKADGCYLPKETGNREIWNWRPSAL